MSSLIRSSIAAALVLCTVLTCRADTPSITTLHTFNSDSDGNVPYGALVEGADGNFYGTTSIGGADSNGTVFSLPRNGSRFNVLSTFPGSNGGLQSEGALIQASDGNFYGTTFSGGANGFGTLFQVTPQGTLTVLSSFDSGASGANPAGALLEGADGALYGTAEFGGSNNFGTVFKASIPAGTLSPVSTFTGSSDGNDPQSDLIQATDGNFYGTTSNGGSNDAGTFFQVTPNGVRTVLYRFTGGTDGGLPLKGVVQGRDGNFYGIDQHSGSGGAGEIYRISVSGTTTTFTPLYDFTAFANSPYNSFGPLLQASDGNFYGTAYQGGSFAAGAIFEVTPSGSFTLIYEFSNGSDGGFPIGGLIQGDDGKLYGTTAGQGGSSGTIFKVDLGLAAPAPSLSFFTPASAAVGDTIHIRGNHFVGTTGVTFASASGTVAAASFSLASNSALNAVVPAGAVTGTVTVVANGLTGVSTTALVISGRTPPPVGTTTVNVAASDPVASFAGSNSGRLRLSRSSSDLSQPLTVIFKISGRSTAVRGTDYDLVTQGQSLASVTNSVTIPAGRASIGVKVVPITSSTPRPDKNVIFKVKAGAGYTVGTSFKATVLIAGDGG